VGVEASCATIGRERIAHKRSETRASKSERLPFMVCSIASSGGKNARVFDAGDRHLRYHEFDGGEMTVPTAILDFE